MCSTKVLFLIVNVKKFNTYDVQTINKSYSIKLYSNSKICFCLDDITDVENLQDVITFTVSNFMKSRSILYVFMYFCVRCCLILLSFHVEAVF